MSRPLRNVELLMRAYPHRVRSPELQADLIASVGPGHNWPAVRECRSAVVEGLRARARGESTDVHSFVAQAAVDSIAWMSALLVGVLAVSLYRKSGRHATADLEWRFLVLALSLALLALFRSRYLPKVLAFSVALLAADRAIRGFVQSLPGVRSRGSTGQQLLLLTAIVGMFVIGLYMSSKLRSLWIPSSLFLLRVLVVHATRPRVPLESYGWIVWVRALSELTLLVCGTATVAGLARFHRIRPTLRPPSLGLAFAWGLLASGWHRGGAMYALLVGLAALLCTINPRPLLVLVVGPWLIGVASTIPDQLSLDSTASKLNFGGMLVIAALLATFVIRRSASLFRRI